MTIILICFCIKHPHLLVLLRRAVLVRYILTLLPLIRILGNSEHDFKIASPATRNSKRGAWPSEQLIDEIIVRIIDGDVDNNRHLLGQGIPEHGLEIAH